jgi:hypothetical protein
MSKLSIAILFFLILISCEDNSSRCFIDKGEIVKQEIIIEDFSNIRIEDIFNIILVQDTLNKIILEGGENLLPHVKLVVQKDTLLIENSMRCNWLRDYEKVTLSVHFRELKHIVTLAPVNIISNDTLRADTLQYFAIGEIGESDLIMDCGYFRFDDSYSTLGLFKFRGKAGKSRFYVNYGSSVDAMELVSVKSDICQKTIGDIYVNVTEHLRVWIWGPGNVYYSGNPQLVEIMENRSSGKITRID